MEGENNISIDALYHGVGILVRGGDLSIKGKGGLTLNVQNGEKGNVCIKSKQTLELTGGTLRLTAGQPSFTVKDGKKVYNGTSYAVDVREFNHKGAKVTGADQKGGKVNMNDSQQAVYTFPKVIPWLPILLGFVTVVAMLVTLWAVFLRDPQITLAPDYAPPKVEDNAEFVGGDGEKLESSAGGGSVVILFSDGVTVDLSDRKATFSYTNPGESNQNVLVQVVVQDTVIAQSGVVEPGHKLTVLDLLEEVQQSIMLSPGVYEGKLSLHFYNPETGEKAVLNSDLPMKITVQD